MSVVPFLVRARHDSDPDYLLSNAPMNRHFSERGLVIATRRQFHCILLRRDLEMLLAHFETHEILLASRLVWRVSEPPLPRCEGSRPELSDAKPGLETATMRRRHSCRATTRSILGTAVAVMRADHVMSGTEMPETSLKAGQS